MEVISFLASMYMCLLAWSGDTVLFDLMILLTVHSPSHVTIGEMA